MEGYSDKPKDAEILDALVVGAGFSGLYQLYHLRKQGFSVQLVDTVRTPVRG